MSRRMTMVRSSYPMTLRSSTPSSARMPTLALTEMVRDSFATCPQRRQERRAFRNPRLLDSLSLSFPAADSGTIESSNDGATGHRGFPLNTPRSSTQPRQLVKDHSLFNTLSRILKSRPRLDAAFATFIAPHETPTPVNGVMVTAYGVTRAAPSPEQDMVSEGETLKRRRFFLPVRRRAAQGYSKESGESLRSGVPARATRKGGFLPPRAHTLRRVSVAPSPELDGPPTTRFVHHAPVGKLRDIPSKVPLVLSAKRRVSSSRGWTDRWGLKRSRKVSRRLKVPREPQSRQGEREREPRAPKCRALSLSLSLSAVSGPIRTMEGVLERQKGPHSHGGREDSFRQGDPDPTV